MQRDEQQTRPAPQQQQYSRIRRGLRHTTKGIWKRKRSDREERIISESIGTQVQPSASNPPWLRHDKLSALPLTSLPSFSLSLPLPLRTSRCGHVPLDVGEALLCGHDG